MAGLKIGAHVEVRRIDGETARGYILRGPLEYLKHIGRFYHVGVRVPSGEDDFPRGRPRRGMEKNRNTIIQEFGMYEEREIRKLSGRPQIIEK